MRSFRVLLTWVCLLAVIAAVVGGSFMLKEKYSPHAEEEEHAESGKHGGGLDAEAMEKAGVELTPLEAASWKERIHAYGRVVDPSPLVTLDNERRAAEAALQASEAEVERSRDLFAKGGNIARRAVEQAEAQVAADRLKLRATEQRFLLEWGPVIERDREALIAQLLSGEAVLIRAESASSMLPGKPSTTAEVLIPGQAEPREAAVLASAPLVDMKSQAVAWFLKLEKPPVPLPPGLSVDVGLGAGGNEESGVLVPAKAVLHFQGAAWVFVPGEEAGHFERRGISLEHAMKGGWFEAGEFKAGDKVVTAGAASLLAEELKSQIEGD